MGGSTAGVGPLSVGVAGVAAALWLWMASATLRGRPWTRIVSTLLFALATVALRGALGPSPIATRLLAFATGGSGPPPADFSGECPRCPTPGPA